MVMYTSLDMPVRDLIIKMSMGNPGAASVLGMLIAKNAEIDPDSMFGEMSAILQIDMLEIYGPNIWLLYKDVCDQNIVKLCALMRANQLGILSAREIQKVISLPRAEMSNRIDTDDVLTKVQERLPAFGK
jgi:hypothetical protein